jgi:hypothetical protein
LYPGYASATSFGTIVLIPNAFGIQHDTAVCDFAREITTQALQIFGAGLDCDYFGRPGPQRLPREDAYISSGIQHDVALAKARGTRKKLPVLP